ncbi:hypothetical protein [Rhodococcus sp. ARP2]|uniref:hypothetical protein n=1 Tax=Rhodococcus sp. ARP2 TaxID=1661385 RepID=UPI00069CF834|nr:hypothetical protein [Rhodococcus sp. ARP2]
MALEIDLDAILDKRQEETGSRDTFPFVFAGQTWHCMDPVVAEADWKDGLGECETDAEVAEHYLGEEAYEQFLAAGGRPGYVVLAIQTFMQSAVNETKAGPTRRSTSSGRNRKR